MKNTTTLDTENPLISYLHIGVRGAQAYKAIVDTEDLDKLKIIGPSRSWTYSSHGKDSKSMYVTATVTQNGKTKKYKAVRIILGEASEGKKVTHINGNFLDLRKENLNIGSTSEIYLKERGSHSKNNITIYKEYAVVHLPYKGSSMDCLVDIEDIDTINNYPFKFWPRKSSRVLGDHTYYANSSSDNHKGTVSLHRLLMRPSEDMEVDHINGNGLDNRRQNLRVVSKQQNSENRHLRRIPKSGYPNIVVRNTTKLEILLTYPLSTKEVVYTTYVVVSNVNGKPKTLKTFDTMAEAKVFRDQWYKKNKPMSPEARDESIELLAA